MKTEIARFTSEIKDYLFLINQKLITIESYKGQIDTNTMTIENSIKTTSNTLYDMR